MTEIRTLEDVERHNARVAKWRAASKAAPNVSVSPKAANWREWPNLHGEPETKPATPRKEYVPVRQRKRGMNGLESAYARQLEERKAAGYIDWYEFEPMRLKLANGTYYRPDFGVMRDGKLEFHETKGHMREAARVRLNVAADKFPFAFYLVRKTPIGFQVNRVGSVPCGTDE